MKFVRNLAALLLSDAVSKLVSFAVIAYLARVLGPEGLGAFAWAQSAALMIGTLANFGLGEYGILQIAPDRRREHLSTIVSRILGFRSVLGAAALGIFAVVSVTLAPTPQHSDLVLWSAFLTLSAVLAFEWFFTAVEDQVMPGIVRIVSRGVYLVASILFVDGPDDVVVALLIFVASETMLQASLAFVARSRYHLHIRPTFDSWCETLRNVAPLAVYTISSAVFAQADIVVLGLLLPSGEVGLYAGALRVMWLVLSIKYLIAQLLYPKIVLRQANSAESLGAYLSSLHTFAVVAAVGVTSFLVAFAGPLLSIILGPAFEESRGIFVWMAVALFGEICWVAMPYAVIAVDRRAYSGIMVTTGTVKILTVAGLAATGEVVAAASGAAIVNVLLFVWCLLLLRRRSVSLRLARVLGVPLGALTGGAAMWHLMGSSGPLLWALLLLVGIVVLASSERDRWHRAGLRSDLSVVTG